MRRFLRCQLVLLDALLPAATWMHVASPHECVHLRLLRREWQQHQLLLWNWHAGQAWVYSARADRPRAWWGCQ